MFQRKALHLIILFLSFNVLSHETFSQNPILKLSDTFKDSTLWTEVTGDLDSLTFDVTNTKINTYGIYGDTMVNQKQYLKVYECDNIDYFRPGSKRLFALIRYSDDQDSCFVKFDSIAGVDTVEHLLYAFGLSVGDSLHIYLPNYFNGEHQYHVVDSFGSSTTWKGTTHDFESIIITPDDTTIIFPYQGARNMEYNAHSSYAFFFYPLAVPSRVRSTGCIKHYDRNGNSTEIKVGQSCFPFGAWPGTEDLESNKKIRIRQNESYIGVECSKPCQTFLFNSSGHLISTKESSKSPPFDVVISKELNQGLWILQVYQNSEYHYLKFINQ